MKKSFPAGTWLLFKLGIFAVVFQWLYFSTKFAQVQTDLAATEKQLTEVRQQLETLSPDAAKALENQRKLVEDLQTKFSGYDQSLQGIVEAIKTLQQQVAQSPKR